VKDIAIVFHYQNAPSFTSHFEANTVTIDNLIDATQSEFPALKNYYPSIYFTIRDNQEHAGTVIATTSALRKYLDSKTVNQLSHLELSISHFQSTSSSSSRAKPSSSTPSNDKVDDSDASIDESIDNHDNSQPQNSSPLHGIASIILQNNRIIQSTDPITGAGNVHISAQIRNPTHLRWLQHNNDLFQITLQPISRLEQDHIVKQILPQLPNPSFKTAPRIISIEGNIGSGKSILQAQIERRCPPWILLRDRIFFRVLSDLHYQYLLV
jgi:hypothetical protein